jgi:hypothetical protein
MTLELNQTEKPFCDWCGAPTEIVEKELDFGFDSTTGQRQTVKANFVRCTKLRGLGKLRNAFYDRETEGFGHTDDRLPAH